MSSSIWESVFLIAEFSNNTLSTNIFPISLPSTTRSCSIQMQVGMVTGVAKPDLEQTLKNPRARMKIIKGNPFSSCVRVSQEHAKNASAATTCSRRHTPLNCLVRKHVLHFHAYKTLLQHFSTKSLFSTTLTDFDQEKRKANENCG